MDLYLLTHSYLSYEQSLLYVQHVLKTDVLILVHMIDMSGSEGRDPFDDYQIINKELVNYKQRLEHSYLSYEQSLLYVQHVLKTDVLIQHHLKRLQLNLDIIVNSFKS
jgi:GTPase involved in cell partitioning and DNA repair